MVQHSDDLAIAPKTESFCYKFSDYPFKDVSISNIQWYTFRILKSTSTTDLGATALHRESCKDVQGEIRRRIPLE